MVQYTFFLKVQVYCARTKVLVCVNLFHLICKLLGIKGFSLMPIQISGIFSSLYYFSKT